VGRYDRSSSQTATRLVMPVLFDMTRNVSALLHDAAEAAVHGTGTGTRIREGSSRDSPFTVVALISCKF
jgi:hypothetical protein